MRETFCQPRKRTAAYNEALKKRLSNIRVKKLSKIQDRSESKKGSNAYGENVRQPDVTPTALRRKVKLFMNEIKVAAQRAEEVEIETRGQCQAGHETREKWLERKKIHFTDTRIHRMYAWTKSS